MTLVIPALVFPNTWKYITSVPAWSKVNYAYLIPRPVQANDIFSDSSSACENNTLTLSCPRDTAIDIIEVVYGRLNNDVCPISNYTGTTDCSSENATTIIEDR